MAYIDECWWKIQWLPVDTIDHEVELYISLIGREVLVLDIDAPWLKNAGSGSEDLSCMDWIHTPEWESRYDEVDTLRTEGL